MFNSRINHTICTAGRWSFYKEARGGAVDVSEGTLA